MSRYASGLLHSEARVTAFADMEAVSPILRRHEYEHPPGTKRYNLWFMCPGCDEPHAFDERWQFNGDYDRPTFSPSFLTWIDPQPFISGKRCHSYVRDGSIEYQSDCTHELAGKTVPLPAWPAARRRRRKA